MKKFVSCGELCRTIVIVIVIVIVTAACSSLRQIQVVREVSRDTIYLNHIQYDSIYVDNWQLTDRSRDTIYLEKSHIEYRYKLLRDTVRVVQIDSIPVIRTIEVVKTEKYVPGIYKWSLGILIVIVIVIVISILWKIKF